METACPDTGLCERDIIAISAPEVLSLLSGKELEIIDIVKQAYAEHHRKASSLPHSTFLNFPGDPMNRIIALPAYLGGSFMSAGVKWIASFPGNLEQGLDRASALMILNSMKTGRPKAVLEGSVVSAKRTAASAALAASVLLEGPPQSVALIGCGKINFEIARFLLAIYPKLETFFLYDTHHQRACNFQEQCRNEFPSVKTSIASGMDSVLRSALLVSFATTATKPYVADLRSCAPSCVILHISLRDLMPETILVNGNVVDDIDHVCRAQTSLHLAERQVQNRSFIRSTLGDIICGMAPARDPEKAVSIFSPFGLGILDVALGEYVFQQAACEGMGTLLEYFLPESWKRTSELVSD